MVRTKQKYPAIVAHFHTGWIGLVALLFAALVVMAANRASAAPLSQTVPPPTPPPPTQVPQATATPQRERDNAGDRQPEQPTPTPPASERLAQQPPTVNEPTALILAERLNVRAGPGTAFAILGVVVGGETVRLLERNADSSWFRICCATGTSTEGWVSAPFIQLNLDSAVVSTLVPLASQVPVAALPAEPAAATAAITASPAVTASVPVPAAAAPITPPQVELAIAQTPPFAQQGDEVTLTFVVTNPGTTTAPQVELRDEFPAELHFIEARAANNAEVVEEELDEGRLALIITWPEVAGGTSVAATVRVRIVDEVADGAVIDNLAVISAAGGTPATSGISIGMPPAALPTFQ